MLITIFTIANANVDMFLNGVRIDSDSGDLTHCPPRPSLGLDGGGIYLLPGENVVTIHTGQRALPGGVWLGGAVDGRVLALEPTLTAPSTFGGVKVRYR